MKGLLRIEAVTDAPLAEKHKRAADPSLMEAVDCVEIELSGAGPGDPAGLAVAHGNDTPCKRCRHPMGSHWKRNPRCSECGCHCYECSELH